MDSTIRRECVGLTPVPIQGKHQQLPEPLAIRVEQDERLELGNKLPMPARGQAGLGAVPEGIEAQLLEPGDRRLRRRGRREVDKGQSAPDVECGAQCIGPCLRPERARLGDQALEPEQVERVVRDDDAVSAVEGLDGVGTERPTQRGDVVLEGRARRRRRIGSPELVEQLVCRHDAVRVQEQYSQKRALLRRAGRHELAVAPDLERSEDAVLDRGLRHRSANVPPLWRTSNELVRDSLERSQHSGLCPAFRPATFQRSARTHEAREEQARDDSGGSGLRGLGSVGRRERGRHRARTVRRCEAKTEQIVFQSNRADGNQDVYVMNADSSNVRRLTFAPGFDGMPRWSPDGKRIAFVSDRDGNTRST